MTEYTNENLKKMTCYVIQFYDHIWMILHPRLNITENDFHSSNSVFINLTAFSGGAIYINSSLSNVDLSHCIFASCTVQNLGGSIAIGLSKSFINNFSCFLSNSAKHGHNMYFNSYHSNLTTHFEINGISELGGSASHGSIYGANIYSSLSDINTTYFLGIDVGLYFHYNTAKIDVNRYILSNSSLEITCASYVVSGPINLNQFVSIHSGNKVLHLNAHSCQFSMLDSTFILNSDPKPLLLEGGVQLIIKRCRSNKDINEFKKEGFDFEVIENPLIATKKIHDCIDYKTSAEICFSSAFSYIRQLTIQLII